MQGLYIGTGDAELIFRKFHIIPIHGRAIFLLLAALLALNFLQRIESKWSHW
jgi:hypothetical protein